MGLRLKVIFLFLLTSFILSSSILSETPPEKFPEEQISQIDERKINLLYTIGLKYYRQRRYREAHGIFEELSKIHPHYKRLDHYLALTKEKIAREEREKEELEKRLFEVMREKYIYDLYTRGLYDMQYGRYEEAIEEFQEILRVNPEHQGARKNLIKAYSLLRKKKIEFEERKMDLIERIKEKEIEDLYKEGKELLENNREEEALEIFEKVFEIDPEYKDIKRCLIDTRLALLVKERKEEGAPYTLGPDDVIEINVLNHPELSGSVVIEPGGEVILPLVRDVIEADGLTKEELAQKIKEVLTKYIKEPEVNVVITGYNSKKWYILGEVGLRGEYPLGKRRLTLMEALYQAGLPIEGTAAMGRVLVIKPHKRQPIYHSIDVSDILYKGKMAQNILIESGDIIYVPKTVLSKITTVVGQIVSPITGTRISLEDIVAASTAVRQATPIKEIIGPTPEE